MRSVEGSAGADSVRGLVVSIGSSQHHSNGAAQNGEFEAYSLASTKEPERVDLKALRESVDTLPAKGTAIRACLEVLDKQLPDELSALFRSPLTSSVLSNGSDPVQISRYAYQQEVLSKVISPALASEVALFEAATEPLRRTKVELGEAERAVAKDLSKFQLAKEHLETLLKRARERHGDRIDVRERATGKLRSELERQQEKVEARVDRLTKDAERLGDVREQFEKRRGEAEGEASVRLDTIKALLTRYHAAVSEYEPTAQIVKTVQTALTQEADERERARASSRSALRDETPSSGVDEDGWIDTCIGAVVERFAKGDDRDVLPIFGEAFFEGARGYPLSNYHERFPKLPRHAQQTASIIRSIGSVEAFAKQPRAIFRIMRILEQDGDLLPLRDENAEENAKQLRRLAREQFKVAEGGLGLNIYQRFGLVITGAAWAVVSENMSLFQRHAKQRFLPDFASGLLLYLRRPKEFKSLMSNFADQFGMPRDVEARAKAEMVKVEQEMESRRFIRHGGRPPRRRG